MSVVWYSLPLLVIQDGGGEREGRERERATGPEVEFSAACLAVINVCFAPVQGVDFF